MRATLPAALLATGLALVASSAVAQTGRSLEILPSSGDCDNQLTILGSGFPADATIVIEVPELFPDIGEPTPTPLAEATANSRGEFEIVLAARELHPDCVPGAEIFLQARVRSGPTGAMARAAYTIEAPWTVTLNPASGPCEGRAERVVVSGDGFPPNRAMVILLGDVGPLAHNFAEVGRATTDTSGAFAVEVDVFCPGEGQPSEVGVYVMPAEPLESEGPIRGVAVFTAGSPTPPQVGSAGLATDGASPESLRVESLTLTLLIVAAWLIRARVGRTSR